MAGTNAALNYDEEFSSAQSVTNPLVFAAAQRLIERHRQGHAIYIEAMDIPHRALVQIARKLESLGVSEIMADHVVAALKDYIVSRGGSFARAAQAKPIFIAAEVADRQPDFRFENGVTEIAAIDQASAIVEGIGNVELQSTVSGTVMTSNRADIDRMFSGVRGHKLWIRFESPSQEELDGLMTAQQMAMTAIAQAMGGGMSAEELEQVLEQWSQEGLLTPEIEQLVADLIELRSLAEADVTPETEARLAELIQSIVEQMAAGVVDGSIPLSLIKGVMEALDALIETHGLGDLVDAPALQALQIEVQAAEIIQKLEALSLELEGDDRIALDDLIESLKGLDAKEIMAILSDPEGVLATMDLPEGIRGLRDAIAADVAILELAVMEHNHMAAQALPTMMAGFEGLENVPPQLQDMDFETVSVEQVAEMLDGKSNPAVVAISAQQNFSLPTSLIPHKNGIVQIFSPVASVGIAMAENIIPLNDSIDDMDVVEEVEVIIPDIVKFRISPPTKISPNPEPDSIDVVAAKSGVTIKTAIEIDVEGEVEIETEVEAEAEEVPVSDDDGKPDDVILPEETVEVAHIPKPIPVKPERNDEAPPIPVLPPSPSPNPVPKKELCRDCFKDAARNGPPSPTPEELVKAGIKMADQSGIVINADGSVEIDGIGTVTREQLETIITINRKANADLEDEYEETLESVGKGRLGRPRDTNPLPPPDFSALG